MRIPNIVVSTALLLSVASCGDNSSSKTRAPAVDPLITSADWKIVLEGRSFPNKALVAIDDEIVVNECADKQSFFIDRSMSPETLPMPSYKVPQKNTVKVAITDLGDCSGSNESEFVPATNANYEMTKTGAHAEVLVRL